MPSRTENFAPAKVNLLLHVGDRREDGYHEIESLAVFADVGDKMIFERADTLSLTVEGPFGAALAGESDNLVLRAARLLAAHVGREPNARITLIKNLPVASGIGGGSADAAATLRGLAYLWEIREFGSNLGRELAEQLGSDVPVCIDSRSSWMEGRGEIVTWARGVAPASMVLVNPGVAVPTAKVFGALKTRTGIGRARPLVPLDPYALMLADYLRGTANDLEAPAIGIAPVIGEVLAALDAQKDVLIARMSGSGATCFALFENPEPADEAARAIEAQHPDWWVQATAILS